MKSFFDRQNPWRQPGFKFPNSPYIQRRIHQRLIEHLSKKEISVLIGTRQVGKTFAIQKLIEYLLTEEGVQSNQIFYFNLDAMEFVELVKNENLFFEFLNLYGTKKQRRFVFLDEVQRVPDCGLLLKRYYDLGINIKFVVSGSSSLEIKSQLKESLTGRKRVFEMLPISFSEFLIFHNIKVDVPFEHKFKFESDVYHRFLNEFILFGGYPGVVMLDRPDEKIELLEEIYRSYVQKDISDFLKVQDIIGFNRLVQMLAAQNAGLLKTNEISKLTGISSYRIEQYLHFLEDTYIIKRLRPYFKNLGKSIIKSPKAYFIDTGIYNTVFKQFQDIEMRSDQGQVLENFVFCELIKQMKIDTIWFYRTIAGSEVDFLLNHGGRLELVEVKYSKTRQHVIPKIFRSLLDRLDFIKAHVLTRDYTDERDLNGIPVSFKPVWSVMEFE